MNKCIKIILILAAVIIGLLLLIMAVSPIAKHVVEKHSQDWIGRDVTVERIFINPFNGSVTIDGFACKEQNRTTDFLAFQQLYVNAKLWKLLGKNVDLQHIHLTDFTGEVLNGDSCFNFTDIINRFSKDSQEVTDTMPSKWHVALNDIRLINGKLVYIDVPRDKQWSIDNVNLQIPGLYFGPQQSNAGLQFNLPEGGTVALTAGYVMTTRRYALTLNMDTVNTDIALPFIQESLPVSELGADLSGWIHIDGSLDNLKDMIATCDLRLDGLILPFVDKKMTIMADTITVNMLNGRLLEHGFAADTIRVGLENLTYDDRSMAKPFTYTITSLSLSGDELKTGGETNQIFLNAGLLHGGKLKVDYAGNLDLKNGQNAIFLKLTDTKVKDFSPFAESYMGYPLEDGVLAFQSTTAINCSRLNSSNLVNIDRMMVGNQMKPTDAPYKNIPLKLGVNMLKSSKGMIVMDLPITGDLSSPKFKLGQVIGRVLLKVFFGPLMGLRDDRKMISGDEYGQMMELLGEDSVALIQAADTIAAVENIADTVVVEN
ncbi:MAG: DUF748 domain-containing protein [Paludibacteraceae bacterium]|nr:DUF748 domain-containing protein [Paludibacteraceae bacterium]